MGISITNAQIIVEENGLVVAEVEMASASGSAWLSQTDIAGYSGSAFYLGTQNSFSAGGKHILNYKILIKTAGSYQLNIRSRIAQGTTSTDHNDHFVRMLSGNSAVLAPIFNNNTLTGTWYKFYQNKINIWTWQTSNKDNDPKSLSYNLAAGIYWVQISMRSAGCAIDKLVLWNKSKTTLASVTTGITSNAQNAALDVLSLSKIDPDANPLPGAENPTFSDPTSRRFNTTTDILIAQFDNKPDPDDIHSQAALASILAHNDHQKIKYFAVTGAYGLQTGAYINSNSLFTLAFGAQNGNWTDANADRAASVTRIVAKVKPIIDAGGWVWVQEAGQSDITADWIKALIDGGMLASKIKNQVMVVQHSGWNENSATVSKLDYVKTMSNYVALDDGNEDFGVYTTNRPKRQFPTPDYELSDKTYMTEVKNSSNLNTKARDIWIEADRIIVASGFKETWSTIVAGGVDFSDCVENWYILNLGENANTARKFWNRYVVNDNSLSVNSPIGGLSDGFTINQVAVDTYKIISPFKSYYTMQLYDINGKMIKIFKMDALQDNFFQYNSTTVQPIIVVINDGSVQLSKKCIFK